MTTHWFPRIVVVIVSWLAVVAVLHFLKPKEPEAKPTQPQIVVDISKEDIEKANNELTKYESLLKTGNKLPVNAKPINTPDFTPDDKDANNRIAKDFLINNSIKIETRGQIDEGYLYVRVSAGSEKSLLSGKESVYIYLDTGVNGGHLFKPKSLIEEPAPAVGSQYLYRLDAVSFTSLPYSDDNSPMLPKDWLKILQDKGTHYIGGFVSSNRQSAIQEIQIIYKGEKDALGLR